MGVSLSRASLVCSWGASYSGVEGLLVRGSVFLLRRPEGESVEGRERRRARASKGDCVWEFTKE